MPKSSRSAKSRGSLFPSKSRSQSRSQSTLPARRATASTQPQTRTQTQSQPTIQKGPGMADSMKQGFGLGVGLEGARAAMGAVGGLFSGNSESSPPQGEQMPQSDSQTFQQSEQQTNEVCGFEKSVYHKCLQEQNNLLANCEDFFRMWEKCQINSQETIDEILD